MWRKSSPLLLACGLLAQQPQTARLHHLHLNSADPAADIAFYTKHFVAEKRPFAGADAVWADPVWLLIQRTAQPPVSAVTSGIWHMGWGGGPDMKATYAKLTASGVPFSTPLTDLSDQCDGKGGNERFLFAYAEAPSRALIEINTTPPNQFGFGHLHLLSADPLAAADWYEKHFGLTRRSPAPPSRQPRFRCGRQTGPSASLMAGGVNVIFYPVENAKAAFPEAWRGRTAIESSAGHAIDHIAFAVDRLDQTIARLREAGVPVNGSFAEGPDRVRIELLDAAALR